MGKPLISLIAPCYNISGVCDKFFESLLSQTYTNIELIIVNDGSTDETEKKVLSYKEALEAVGYTFKYIYQENKGLGGAVNTGLKHVDGEFLCWADPDDYFENNSFELRLNYMLEHPNCAIVSSDAYTVNGDNKKLLSISFPHTKEPKQFDWLLKKESMFCSGCHMIRMSCFDKVNPKRDIYEYRRGQNWQLLLPIYYEYDRDFLEIPLYNYVVYDNSMSHIKETYEQKVQRNNEHKTVILETLKRMKLEDEALLSKIECIYERINLGYAYTAKKKDDYKKCYKKLKGLKNTSFKDFVKLLIVSI